VRGGIRLRRAEIGGDFVAKNTSIISRRYADAMCLESKEQCQGCLRKLRGKLINDNNKTLYINRNENGWEEIHGKFNPSCINVDVTKPVKSYNPDERSFDAIHLHEAHIKGAVELIDGLMSVGEVSLNSAKVDGGSNCSTRPWCGIDGV
jgi:hypothetical protein